MPRCTVAVPATVSGTGLHTGALTRLTFRPGRAGQGLVFRRSDLPGAPGVPARLDRVRATDRRTALGQGPVGIETVEQVLALFPGISRSGATITGGIAEALGRWLRGERPLLEPGREFDDVDPAVADASRVEASPVVLDDEPHDSVRLRHEDPDAARIRMLEDVGDRLLRDAVEDSLGVGGQALVGNLRLDVDGQATVLRHRIDEALDRVPSRRGGFRHFRVREGLGGEPRRVVRQERDRGHGDPELGRRDDLPHRGHPYRVDAHAPQEADLRVDGFSDTGPGTPGGTGSTFYVSQIIAEETGVALTIDASSSSSVLCPGGVLEYQLRWPGNSTGYQFSPIFTGLLPGQTTDFDLDVRCADPAADVQVRQADRRRRGAGQRRPHL